MVLAKNFQLSRSQYDLLLRGLSFVPTIGIGKHKKQKFKLDLQEYHRKIKLATFFKNSRQKERIPFMGTSGWSPPLENLPIGVRQVIEQDLNSLERHYKPFEYTYNLTKLEINSLRALQKIKNIVIKPADKGSAIVILSREQYIFEVERQLNDGVYYKKLDKPIYKDTIPMVEKILGELKRKKFINTRQEKYLRGDHEPRERRFYVLPKIHKDPKKWTVPFEVPPGRPIVSDCGSETYFTAEFLDFYLNPLSIKHPSYVKDTYHFLEIVKELRIPANSYFFSMDVESLYTNIDIVAGMNSVKKIFERYPDPKRPDTELLQLLEINLTRNDFMFNEQFYLQIKGTAMGKRFAPAYANIFMAIWEEEVLPKCKKRPFYYLRYLDDLFGVWQGSKEEFFEFLDIINSHDPSIKLQAELDRREVNFLDTTVYKGATFSQEHKVDVKVYFKKTDTHALLHKSSFHPRHTFRGLVKSQILRFWRICTHREDFLEAVRILFKALRKRGYSRSFLRHCFKSFQEDARERHGDLIPLITTYSLDGTILNKKWKNNFQECLGRFEVIPGSRVISAFRRNPNLRDLLVRAKLPPLTQTKPQAMNGQFCKMRFISNSKDGTLIEIKQVFSTRSKNCVYMIFCVKCGAKYIGETRNMLSVRMAQHKYNIKNKRDTHTPLVRHFLFHGLGSVRVAGIEKNFTWSDWERKRRERYWIYTLGTREPDGLNWRTHRNNLNPNPLPNNNPNPPPATTNTNPN